MHMKRNKLVPMYTNYRGEMGGLKKYVQTIQSYCNNILVPRVVVLRKLLPYKLKQSPIYTNHLISLHWQNAGKTPLEECHF